MKLDGRVVLITGAARGIGAALAREVARRGAHVSLVGLEPLQLAAVHRELGEGHAAFEADVTDQAALEAAVAGTVEQLGGIDVVVANAGIASYGTVAQIDPEAFARTIDINVTGAFRTIHAALPHVLERRGYVQVVASVASFAPLGGLASYSASKAGVESFAAALGMEVARHGVAVGCVHPGWIDTDLVREAERDLPAFQRMRRILPWPLRSTTSAQACARAMADGIERRARKVYVPRSVALLHWIRALLNSRVADAGVGLMGRRLLPEMEAEVAALGRSYSPRTTAISPPEAGGASADPAERAPAA